MPSSEYNYSHVYFLMGRFTPMFTEYVFCYRSYVLTNNGISGVELDGGWYILEDKMLYILHEGVKKTEALYVP